MQPIIFDREKCKEDGICAAICPRKLISWSPAEPQPRAIPEAPELCIHCGHCLAVCPVGAITLEGVGPEDCQPLQKSLLPAYDSLDQLFKARRSIRPYLDKPVDRQVMEKLLNTCRYAPTGSNSRSVHWAVVTDLDKIHELSGLVVDWMRQATAEHHELVQHMRLDVVVEAWEHGQDRISRGAPCLVLTHAPVAASMPREDCIIALTYLDLAASIQGLGACWLGYMMHAAHYYPPLLEALDLPKGHKVHGAMLLGYPSYKYRLIPPRDQAKVVWW